jgi:alkylhydroperoxidase family enzyme
MTRLDDDEIARNRDGPSNDTRRAAALAFAREVALTRGKVSDCALDAVRVVGFTDAQILEIIAVVVLFTMSNYFNKVMKIDIDVFPDTGVWSSGWGRADFDGCSGYDGDLG